MQWSAQINAGFSPREPWLPVTADYVERNVEAQDADTESMLTLVRTLLLLRKLPSLQEGGYQSYKSPEGVYAYLRGAEVLVALNFTNQPKALGVPAGEILLSTHLERYGTIGGKLELRPNEGVMLKLA